MRTFKNTRTADADDFPICPLCSKGITHGQEAAADGDVIVHLECWKRPAATPQAPGALAPDTTTAPGGRAPKCARCSQPITALDARTSDGGELFHTSCWRVLASERTLAAATRRVRSARKTLDAHPGVIRCVRCSRGIERSDDILVMDAGAYHRACFSPSSADLPAT